MIIPDESAITTPERNESLLMKLLSSGTAEMSLVHHNYNPDYAIGVKGMRQKSHISLYAILSFSSISSSASIMRFIKSE